MFCAPNIHAAVSKTDLFTRSELRVAILATAKKRRAELEYYCDQNDIRLTTVECSSSQEMRDMNQCGARRTRSLDIDVNAQDGFHIIASFAERPFFFAAPKGDREIIDEIDATIEHINEDNPQLQNNLYKKVLPNL